MPSFKVRLPSFPRPRSAGWRSASSDKCIDSVKSTEDEVTRREDEEVEEMARMVEEALPNAASPSKGPAGGKPPRRPTVVDSVSRHDVAPARGRSFGSVSITPSGDTEEHAAVEAAFVPSEPPGGRSKTRATYPPSTPDHGGPVDDVDQEEDKENAKAAPHGVRRKGREKPERDTLRKSNVSRAYDEAMANGPRQGSAKKSQGKKTGRPPISNREESGRAFGGSMVGRDALAKASSSRKLKGDNANHRTPVMTQAALSPCVSEDGSGSVHGARKLSATRGLHGMAPDVEEVRSEDQSEVGAATLDQDLHASAPPLFPGASVDDVEGTASKIAAVATVAAMEDDSLHEKPLEAKETSTKAANMNDAALGEQEIQWVPSGFLDEGASKSYVPARPPSLNPRMIKHDPVRLLMPYLVNYGQPPNANQAWRYIRQTHPGGPTVLCEQPPPPSISYPYPMGNQVAPVGFAGGTGYYAAAPAMTTHYYT